MNISPTQRTSNAQSSQAQSGGRPSKGGPGGKLEKDLSNYLTEQGVSSDKQAAIKTQLKEAITELQSSGLAIDPTQVKAALSEILTENGLDGETFVSGLGTPGTSTGTQRGGSGQSGSQGGKGEDHEGRVVLRHR